MTSIAILPEPSQTGEPRFRALSGSRQSFGSTPGEALDALRALLKEDETTSLYVIQEMQPDHFFTESQTRRLSELMQRVRESEERTDADLTIEERAELESLIEAELQASALRSASLADALGR